MECSSEVDAFGNNAVINTAKNKDWQQVRTFMAEGRNVRNCNCFGQNALFFAILDGQFELATELYKRGARLSGLSDNPESEALAVITDMIRLGMDLFHDEHYTLSECCRNGYYDQAESLIENAALTEKSQALRALIRRGNYRPELNLKLFKRLIAAGADPEDKTDDCYNCRELLEVIKKRPKQLALEPEYIAEVEKLIE